MRIAFQDAFDENKVVEVESAAKANGGVDHDWFGMAILHISRMLKF